MLSKLPQRFLLLISNILGIIFLFSVLCFAQEPAKLKTLKLEKNQKGVQLVIEHSKPPVDYQLKELDSPRRLIITFVGSKVTFRDYENIPIEIPVNEEGVNRIIVQEKFDYNQTPSELVVITVEMDRPVYYDVDSQWNGQFLNLVISSLGTSAQKKSLAELEKEMAPTMRLEKIRAIKTTESEKAKERLNEFTQTKRIELIRKESKATVSKARKQAKKRIDAASKIEKSYKKLKAETEISTLPIARDQMVERNLYKDITMPSEVKPIVRRNPPSKEVTSLEDCINLALLYHIPVQIAQEQEKLAKLRVREARRSFYPAFLGEWNEVDGNTVTEPYRGRSYGLQAEQSLFSGGKLTATLRKEQLGELIARGNFERVKQDLNQLVSKAYYELVMAKNTLDLMERLKETEEVLISEVEKEFSIESATPADLLTAQATYNQVCYQVSYAERTLALAKLALEKESFTENLNIDNINLRLSRKKLDTKLEECLELAFNNRPELQILDKTIKAAKYTQDIIKSEEFPNLTLSGSYGRSGEAFTQRDLNLATEWKLMGTVKWFLGGNTVESSYKKDKVSPFRITSADTNVDSQALNTKFSFWDNLAHFSKDKEAQITRKQAQKDYEEMKNKIRQETEDAYYTFHRFNTQLSLAINEIGFRRKQLEIVKAKRKMNEATAAEVMSAELQITQANASLQEALAGINIAIVSLNRAIGIINHFY